VISIRPVGIRAIWLAALILCFIAALAGAPATHAQQRAAGSTSAGFDRTRLDGIDRVVSDAMADHKLPGAVVVDFAVIDAAAHAWDLSSSVGRAIEFPLEWIPAMTDVVALTCNDQAIEIGLIKPPTEPPADATDTERLMALAGRTIAQ